MTKNERNKASPRMTCVGGIFWVPIACRTNPRTITILVKQVVINRIAGATEIMVRMNKTWSAVDTCCGVFASSTPKVMVGRPIAKTFPLKRKQQQNRQEKKMSKLGRYLLFMTVG